MAVDEYAIERLRNVLNKISVESTDEYYKGGAKIRDAKITVLARYQPIFSFENLDNLTSEDFKSFLLFKNNYHWDSLHRQSNKMTADMDKLKKALKVLLDEKLNIKTRLDQLRPGNEEPMVSGLGRAVITAILHIAYPDKYGIWNNTAEDGLKELNLWPTFRRGASFGQKYEIINKVLLEVAQALGTDLWTLDMLWWVVLCTHLPSGIGSVSELSVLTASKQEEIKTDLDIAPSEAIFGLEKYLHEFLVDNWEKVKELSNEWSLLEEDGEIVGSKYNTREVGEIDLLAKHKKENRWLVIELKKNQTSDATVGQAFRYITWVRKQLAAKDDKVEGLIVCHEVDKNLQYAIDGQPNIRCMTYQVNFTLNSIQEL